MNYPRECLARGQAFADVFTERPLADVLNKGLDDRQRDVSLEQREANLADGVLDICVSEPALSGQVLGRPA